MHCNFLILKTKQRLTLQISYTAPTPVITTYFQYSFWLPTGTFQAENLLQTEQLWSQFLWEKNSTHIDCKLTYCATELKRNLSYCHDFILIANFLIMVFLPLFLLIVLNGHIYCVLVKSSRRRSRQSIIKRKPNSKRDHRIATILMMIVIVFGCCNVFPTLLSDATVINMDTRIIYFSDQL